MIDTIGHEALIYIKTEQMGAKERLVAIIENLKVHSSVVGVSTVYSSSESSVQKQDPDLMVELVCRLRTRLDVMVLKSELDQLKGFRVDITLLVYDDLISMVPQLTLPWPDLHKEGLVIRAAAEVHPHYIHPVFKESLADLSGKNQKIDKKVEFFMQGRILHES